MPVTDLYHFTEELIVLSQSDFDGNNSCSRASTPFLSWLQGFPDVGTCKPPEFHTRGSSSLFCRYLVTQRNTVQTRAVYHIKPRQLLSSACSLHTAVLELASFTGCDDGEILLPGRRDGPRHGGLL